MEKAQIMENEPSPISSSGRLVRWFVGGLPLGLLVMGVGSFFIYFHMKRERPPELSEFARMLQKEVNAADFERYVKILADDIGGSAMTEDDKREAVTVFVESSMGMDNMGYQVARERLAGGNEQRAAVYAELPGRNRSAPKVLVVTAGPWQFADAGQTRKKAACVAAVMGVAHALAGEVLQKTVRFAVVDGDDFEEIRQGSGTVVQVQPERWPEDMTGETAVVAFLRSLQQEVMAAAAE